MERRIPSRERERDTRIEMGGDHRSRPIVDVDWIANYWRSLTLSRRQLRRRRKEDLGHTPVARFCRFFRLVFEVFLRERQPLVLSRANSQTELYIFTLSLDSIKVLPCTNNESEWETRPVRAYCIIKHTYKTLLSVPRCSLVCLWPAKLLAPNSLQYKPHTHTCTHINARLL